MNAHRLMAVVATVAIITAGCAPRENPSGPPASATSNQSSGAGLPPLLDVPEYRANAARTGVYAGPGPVEEPEVVWSRKTGASINFNPVIGNGLLLFGDVDGGFYALDARTGDERWRFEQAGPPGFEVTGNASVADGTVVFTSGDGDLYALDLGSGEQRWSAKGKGAGLGAIQDHIVYTVGTDGTAYGLDLASGELRWSWDSDAEALYLAVDGDTAYVSVADGRLFAISTTDAVERWHFQTISRPGVAVIAPDTVFINAGGNEGELYALDRATGAVSWRFRGQSGRQLSLGAIRDGTFYSGTVEDGIFAFPVKADGAAIQPLWHADYAGSIWKNAALVDDVIYFPVADPGAVVAVDAGDGSELWRLPLEGAAQGILVSGGMLFAADDSGRVAAYAEADTKGAIGETAAGVLNEPPPSPSAPPDPFTVDATFDWATTTLETPLGMDIGPDGLLYVIDVKPSVTVIDPATGKPVRSWGRQGTRDGEFDFTRPEDDNPGIGAIAIAPDGRVVVADGANHRVQVFDPDGEFVRKFGTFGDGDGQFSRPYLIDVGPDGSAFVKDHDLPTISRFDASGGFVWQVKAPGTHGLAVDQDGNVIVFQEVSGPAVVLDSADGSSLRNWGPDLGASGEGRVDATGTVHVFQYVPAANLVVDAAGTVVGARYSDVFYPPPVMAPDGFGYSFNADGLVRLKVAHQSE